MKNIKTPIVILLSVILVATVFYFFYYQKTPVYALYTIHKAIKENDLATFEKYVDLDSVLSHAYDDLILYSTNDMSKEESLGVLAFSKFLKAPVTAIAKNQTKEYINKEKIPTKDNNIKKNDYENQETQSLLNFKKFDFAIKERFKNIKFKEFGDYKNKNGIATAQVVFYDQKSQKDITLTIEMSKTSSSNWKVTRFLDLSEMLDAIEIRNKNSKLKNINFSSKKADN